MGNVDAMTVAKERGPRGLWLAVAVLVTLGTARTLWVVLESTGFAGLVAGAALAGVPVFALVVFFLWLDRYESEPNYLLVFSFVWGACVATAGSELARIAAGGLFHSPTTAQSSLIVVVPLVEELFKAVGLLVIIVWYRHEFDGIIDGLVYAGMIGLGFAFIENVLYLGQAVADGQAVSVFILRCLMSPLAHPLFTSAVGLGLGMAIRRRWRGWYAALPFLGLITAIVMHSIWNQFALSGLQGFLWSYVLIQVPIFVGYVAVAVIARRRERWILSRNLAGYSKSGWLTPEEVAMLCSPHAREQAIDWALKRGGPVAAGAMQEFQEMATQLALTRDRIRRGAISDAGHTYERGVLVALVNARRTLLSVDGCAGGAPREVLDETDAHAPQPRSQTHVRLTENLVEAQVKVPSKPMAT